MRGVSRSWSTLCPEGVECAIAEHACLKSSGRVGRTAAAKSMDESVVRLAVIAHIRHTQTIYEQLLARGFDRLEARSSVHRRHAHLEIVSDRNARLVDEASLDPGRGTLGGTVPNDDGRTVGPVADPRTILAVRRVGVHLELISDRGTSCVEPSRTNPAQRSVRIVPFFPDHQEAAVRCVAHRGLAMIAGNVVHDQVVSEWHSGRVQAPGADSESG